jgi:hypothetical protein
MCHSQDEFKAGEATEAHLDEATRSQGTESNPMEKKGRLGINRDGPFLDQEHFKFNDVWQSYSWARGSTLCHSPIRCDRVERRRAGHPANPEHKHRHCD